MTITEIKVPQQSEQSWEPERFRFSRELYDKIVEAGILEDKPVELIDGEILQMSPIHNPHVSACSLLTSMLYRTFGMDANIRVQAPLAFAQSEPQPDIAVTGGSPRDCKYQPATALLVVEISDSSLRFDRAAKASLYASANIQEYWILNLKDRQLEVHRNPQTDTTQRFGHRYAGVQILKPDAAITPLAAPNTPALKIADMLP
jgi:Uma2 family endonuclease